MSERKTRWVSTGVKSLDLLFGGYPKRAIALFWGGTGVLKSTLADYLPIVITFDEKDENQVYVVVDTEGGFDWDRLFQIASHKGIDVDILEKRIILFEPATFAEQKSVIIKQLYGGRQKVFNWECDVERCDKADKGAEDAYHYHMFKSLFDDKDSEHYRKKPALIAIDSISWLAKTEACAVNRKFRPVTIGEYVNNMGVQLAMVRKLAVQYDCIATVTSWDISKMGEAMGSSSEYPFIGGRNLAFIPKLNVMCHNITPDELDDALKDKIGSQWANYRQLVLWKHRCMERMKSVLVKVTDAGIEDPVELAEEGGE